MNQNDSEVLTLCTLIANLHTQCQKPESPFEMLSGLSVLPKINSVKRFASFIHTINDPGHSPQPEQDDQAHTIKGIFFGDVHDIQDERHDHNNPIKHLELVVEKLQLKSVQLKAQLHHEEGEQRQAEVVKHLQNDKRRN